MTITLCDAGRDGVPLLRAIFPDEAREDGVDFAMLWSAGHFDGPCSGVGMYRGREVWFVALHDMPLGEADGKQWEGRVFVIVEIAPEELAAERRVHDFFERWVGMHTTYRYEDGRRVRVGEQHAVTRWDDYCAETRGRWRDYGDRTVLGWWEAWRVEVEAPGDDEQEGSESR